MDISQEAYNHIKNLTKTKELYQEIDFNCFSVVVPSIFFMAGSPGAGKTEFSKSFIKEIKLKNKSFSIARIDADEIRELCPQYTGKNSSDIQRAAGLGVNRLYDYCLKKKYNILLDGTFANLEYAKNNIKRALKKGSVQIFYIYQEPEIAWRFTLKREKIEGRNINIDVFVNAFLKSRENIKEVKRLFGKKIRLDVLIRDKFNKKSEKLFINVEDVDKCIKVKYDEKTLIEILENIKI